MTFVDILDRAVFLLRQRFWSFFLLALFVQVPLGLWSIAYRSAYSESFLPSRRMPDLTNLFIPLILYVLLFFTLLSAWAPVVSTALYHLAHTTSIGASTDYFISFRFALKNFFRIVWTVFLVSLVIAGVVVGIGILWVIFSALFRTAGLVITVIFFIPLTVVLLVYFSLGYSLVLPILAVEGDSGWRALQRSRKLMYGYREADFATKGWVRSILMWLFYILISSSVGMLVVIPEQVYSMVHFTRGPAGIALLPFPFIVFTEVFRLLVQALMVSFYSIAWFLFYLDRRIRYEGYDLEVLIEATFQAE